MKVTIEPLGSADIWQLGGEFATLEIYADQLFDTGQGQFYLPGNFNVQDCYLRYECPITASVILIPAVEIDPTTDSLNQQATYSAILRAQNGQIVDFLSRFKVSHLFPNTRWDVLRLQKNLRTYYAGNPLAYDAYELDRVIERLLGNLRTASSTQIGMAASSYQSTDPAYPIHVEVNDPAYAAAVAFLTNPRAAWIEDVIASSASVSLDADLFSCFRIALTSDVAFSEILYNTGVATVIVITLMQDGIGSHGFAWPANLASPPTLNLEPDAVTVFIAKYDPVTDMWFTASATGGGGGGGTTYVSGTWPLVNGVATVPAPLLTSLSVIQLTGQSADINGGLRITSKSPGVSFDITSTDAGDNGDVGYAFASASGESSVGAEGLANLVDGVVTVTTTAVTGLSNVQITSQSDTVVGNLRKTNVVPGVSFDIVSTDLGDNGEVGWTLI